MKTLWAIFLFQPFVNGLVFFNKLFGNLGIAIILLTIIIRLVLLPLTLPAMQAAKKMAKLSPELDNLKKRYKDNKQKLAQAQMELYRKHGFNPAAGCFPQIIQIIILIALYQAFAQVLRADGPEVITRLNEVLYTPLKLAADTKINLSFLYLQLDKPDIFQISGFPRLPGFFLLAAALTQFLSSKMMSPQVTAQEKAAAKTKEKTDDLASAMQTQMLYLFPAMTILIGLTFPSGLVLYWFIFSLFTIIQQYLTAGPGGLKPWLLRIKEKIKA